MWLLPSRRRIPQLQAFLSQAIATGLSTPGYILVKSNELAELRAEYDALSLPPNWSIVGVDADGAMGTIQKAYESGLIGDAKWVGLLQDDQIPETMNWDSILVSRVTGVNIVCSDDGWQVKTKKRLHGALVFSRGIIDVVGYFGPEGLKHNFGEDVWERLTQAANLTTWAYDVLVRHNNIALSNSKDSTSEKIKTFWATDESAFRMWVQKDETAAVSRIMAFLERHGVAVTRPDLAGVSIYLCTPSGSGRYDRSYVRSLLQTKELVETVGGKLDWAEMPYCADLSLARNRILGAFWRGQHTHMLMIDDDMGWNPQDVLRLVMADLPIVGGAGPKKQYPLKFCVDASDENGDPVPEDYNLETDALGVTAIGTGFLMVRRDAIARLINSYPDLVFDTGNGPVEYGLFDPLITPKLKRLSDDFAFCYRWRAVGGKIYVLPGVKLKHTGAHTFEGSLFDMMTETAQKMAAE